MKKKINNNVVTTAPDINNCPFTEDEIRPRSLVQDQQIAILTDIGRLLSRRKEFITISCPACNSSSYIRVFEKRGFTYVKCTECETMFINPRPAPQLLQWFYLGSENYAYWNKYIYPATENARRKRIIRPRVDTVLSICQKYNINTDSLLEIGAGYGSFCSELKIRNVFSKIVAVEPTPDLAQTCRDRGLETIEHPIEEIDFKDTDLFNVIVNFEVIEHLFAPKDFADRVFRFLRPGGILILSCPNGKGFDLQILGKKSDTVDHEHLNYFNMRSLSDMFTRCGFHILDCFTPGKLDAELVRNKIMDKILDISFQPFLKTILIDDWEKIGVVFQDFLANNGLSSNMWLIAKKNNV